MWGPMGPLWRPRKVEAGKCRCSCYCKDDATDVYIHSGNEWAVCARCKRELEEALIPWLQ